MTSFTMASFAAPKTKTGTVFVGFLVLLLSYFVVMDILVYQSLQTMDLVNQDHVGGYSPFRPLSVKLLMLDHIDHYVYIPLAELVFAIFEPTGIYFILTPNVISFTGLFLGFVAGKFVTMESLYHRRIGVLIFEYRMWLDVLDGVVFRHTSGNPVYKSHRTTLGFFIDVDCDIISGVALAFGCLFYLWKYPPAIQPRDLLLPISKPFLNANVNGHSGDSPGKSNGFHNKATKNYIFLKCLIFGGVIVLATTTWDNMLQTYSDVLQIPMETSLQTEKQLEALHSGVTWLSMWLWRFCEAQTLLHFLQLAIVTDKIWEFLNFIQFAGFVALAILNLFSFIQVRRIRAMVGIYDS
ncbi:ceramide phosphoethanolamine synthase-like [Pecten maximus]|uniref:ceramide phosphoethanolamine synthase-like n=1 Tax=Pecten maximus TaxID=6579 RepID=UPI0014580BC0|nr:ceramide phosphoethanolamine synthase-like [Pecten maximus]XP_033743906.1 ceramide phosphoethanolamine synthase-like [Pecten maximus]